MRRVTAQVHYAPDSWRGLAHTYNVRDQFAQLFQYKAVRMIYIIKILFTIVISLAPFMGLFTNFDHTLYAIIYYIIIIICL